MSYARRISSERRQDGSYPKADPCSAAWAWCLPEVCAVRAQDASANVQAKGRDGAGPADRVQGLQRRLHLHRARADRLRRQGLSGQGAVRRVHEGEEGAPRTHGTHAACTAHALHTHFTRALHAAKKVRRARTARTLQMRTTHALHAHNYAQAAQRSAGQPHWHRTGTARAARAPQTHARRTATSALPLPES